MACTGSSPPLRSFLGPAFLKPPVLGPHPESRLKFTCGFEEPPLASIISIRTGHFLLLLAPVPSSPGIMGLMRVGCWPHSGPTSFCAGFMTGLHCFSLVVFVWCVDGSWFYVGLGGGSSLARVTCYEPRKCALKERHGKGAQGPTSW